MTDQEDILRAAFEDRQAAWIREQIRHESTQIKLWDAEECLRAVRTMLATRYDDKDVVRVIDEWAERAINGADTTTGEQQ